MKLNPTMPQFLVTTINLGDDIANELIRASRAARPRWNELIGKHRDFVPHILDFVKNGQKCVFHPLVHSFMTAWARETSWGSRESGCSDAIGVHVPASHVKDLARYGGVDSFELLLGDLANHCCATLGNNDHDRKFGLIVNCPAWIELASFPDYQASFETQLRMVIQHEMAHFIHQGATERSELHAHCRGIASTIRSSPNLNNRDEFLRVVRENHPEIEHNMEMKRFVLDGGEKTWRLVRRWVHAFRRYSAKSHD